MPGVREPALTLTVTLPGVVPLAGLTESQLPPLVVAAVAVKLIDPGVPVTLMLWVAGAGPPCTCEKVSDAGVAASDPAPTVKLTGTVTGVAPGAVMVMVP